MKKGFTLVEVLVSIALFSIMLATILSCYLLASNAYLKEKEYLYFENICLEIDAYSDVYKKDWAVNYFKNDKNEIFYDESFQIVEDSSRYTLSYLYNEKNELIVSIKNNDKNYYVIENLNYGGARYV